ncbi:histidine kinase, partial [Streptomyces sp. BG9H]
PSRHDQPGPSRHDQHGPARHDQHGPAPDGTGVPRPAAEGPAVRHDLAPRAARALTIAALVGYVLLATAWAMSAHPSPRTLGEVGVVLLALLGLQLGHSFPRTTPALAPYRLWTLGLQAVLTFLPFVLFGEAWWGLPGFLAGSVLLLLPAVPGWPLFAAVVTSGAFGLWLVGDDLGDIAYATALSTMTGLVVFGLSRMAELAVELHRSRAEIARAAVTGERLRFARDLHDLLGFSLSTITLKCELAYRLVPDRRERAEQELTEVLRTARQALADVRTVARGYRQMSLTDEAESARSMLAGVGIRTALRLDCGELPTDVDTVLATTLREGLTNMLRHSKAERCTITAEREGRTVRLTLANDGAALAGHGPGAVRDSDANSGSGIGNLTARIRAFDGRLTAGHRQDGWYQLCATVTLSARPV